jgi:hypothetical protein
MEMVYGNLKPERKCHFTQKAQYLTLRCEVLKNDSMDYTFFRYLWLVIPIVIGGLLYGAGVTDTLTLVVLSVLIGLPIGWGLSLIQDFLWITFLRWIVALWSKRKPQ